MASIRQTSKPQKMTESDKELYNVNSNQAETDFQSKDLSDVLILEAKLHDSKIGDLSATDKLLVRLRGG